MPRTAPTYDGTPSYVTVSYKFIDANGTLGSVPYTTTLTNATVANIEAMADALVAASNANLYDIVLETHTEGARTAATAAEEPRESVKDVIMTLTREPASRKTQYVQIPAPLDSLFVPGTNTVDVSEAVYQAVNTAANALLPAAYTFVSTRFSEHKGTNPKTNF